MPIAGTFKAVGIDLFYSNGRVPSSICTRSRFFIIFSWLRVRVKKEKKIHANETEKKRKEIEASLLPVGSIGSNGSGQGWSTQVEELAEHLADFDGSLSALAASDLATAVASYSMR